MDLRDLRNEQGSTVILVIGLLVGSIFLSFVCFDLFTAYMSKRISQTSADAAVLAAAQAARKAYEDHVTGVIQEKFAQLQKDVDEKVAELVDEDTTYEEAWDMVMELFEIRPKFPEIEEKLKNPGDVIEAGRALKYFFRHDEKQIERTICFGIQKNMAEVEAAAQAYARKNGAAEQVNVVFPYDDQFEIYAKVKRPTSFVLVDDDKFAPGARDVYTEAAASIQLPQEIELGDSPCQ